VPDESIDGRILGLIFAAATRLAPRTWTRAVSEDAVFKASGLADDAFLLSTIRLGQQGLIKHDIGAGTIALTAKEKAKHHQGA